MSDDTGREPDTSPWARHGDVDGQEPAVPSEGFAPPEATPHGHSQGEPSTDGMQPPHSAAADGTPQYGAPQYGTPQYGTSQYGAPQYGAAQYGTPQYGTPQYGTSQYGAAQYGAAQYGAPQYGTPQYGTPQYGTPQYGGQLSAYPGAGGPSGVYGGHGVAASHLAGAYGVPGQPPTEPMAGVAMAVGIGSLALSAITCCCWPSQFVWAVGGIVAIVLGATSRRSIAAAEGAKGGAQYANVGMITGGITIVLALLLVALLAFGIGANVLKT